MTLTRRKFSISSGAALLAGFATARAQSEGKIVLGQSAAFTGPAAQLGIQFHQGAKSISTRSTPRAASAGNRSKCASSMTAMSRSAASKTPES